MYASFACWLSTLRGNKVETVKDHGKNLRDEPPLFKSGIVYSGVKRKVIS